MNFFTAFWTWITASPERRLDAGNPDMQPIDVKALSGELNVRSEAKRLGQAGVPNPQAQELCGVEAAIVQSIEKKRNQFVAWSARRLGIHNESIARNDVTAVVQRALAADTRLELAIRDKLAEERASLEMTKATAERDQSELNNFRAHHGIERDARYPTSSKSFLLYSFLLVAICAEAFVNGSFFAEGNPGGLLGGMREAAVYAFFNVAVAYCLGRFGIRFLYHRAPGFKALGAIATIAFMCVALFIALLITHLRNAFATGTSDAQAVAMQTLVTSPFSFGSPDSITLFILSLLFAIGAMWDGLLSDDPYPGYGKVARTAKQSHTDFDDDIREMREEMVELRELHLDAFGKQIKDCQGKLALVAKEIHAKEATFARLHQAILDVENSMDALLKEFRTENEVARGGLPVPSYFARKHVLSELALPAFDTAHDRASLREQEAAVATLLETEQHIRTKMHQVFELQMAPLESFENTVAERKVA